MNFFLRTAGRLVVSDDTAIQQSLDLKLNGILFDLMLDYFNFRDLLWKGEKDAVRYWKAEHPGYLDSFMECLKEPDTSQKLRLCVELAEVTAAPLGGLWEDGHSAFNIRLRPDSDIPSETERALNFWEELVRVTRDDTDGFVMLSGPIEGMLLQFLVWATGARRVLEIGTFTGFSAQMMAAALPSDGVVVTCENDRKHADIAREQFSRGPSADKIDLRFGDALETLGTLSGPFDVVFIDADKGRYIAYYERAMELLSDRGIIAVDNVLWDGRVLNPESETDHAIVEFNRHVREDPRVQCVLLPIRDGVTLVRRG